MDGQQTHVLVLEEVYFVKIPFSAVRRKILTAGTKEEMEDLKGELKPHLPEKDPNLRVNPCFSLKVEPIELNRTKQDILSDNFLEID